MKSQKKTEISVLHKAVKLLAQRSYGSEELRIRLSKTYDQEEVKQALEKLLEMKYLDDPNYVRSYIRDQKNLRRKGPYLIHAELEKKLFPADLIQSTMAEEYPTQEQKENIERLLLKWNKATVSDAAKLLRRLIRKGYAASMAREAVRKHLSGQGFLDTP